MIYDTFEHLELYAQPGTLMHQALVYARDFDQSKADGRQEIDGDRLYALVNSYDSSPREERRYEAHKRYADIQVLLEGEEAIDVSLESNLPVIQEYNPTKDILYHQPPTDTATLVMKPGYFAIFYPQDVHRPNCQLHGKIHVRKIVMKVKVA